MMRTKHFLRSIWFFAIMMCAIHFGTTNTHAATATHSHPVCGASCSCYSDTHSSSTWTAWDGTTKMYNGDHYLTQDVVLESTMILDYSYTSRLCLNGHSITCEDTVLQIYSDRSLLITDCVGTGSFGGRITDVILDPDTAWKDGDIIINNVASDAVAERFTLAGDDWMYLERSGTSLVLRILPHGTWGSNVSWVLEDGTLTISGTGAIDYTYTGNDYPWGDYHDEILRIVVEPGITSVPSYTFEYCEQATAITLPETVTSLALNAFNDCGSLNDLLLPSSLTTITGSSNTGYPAFIRCESLTDVYYLGTSEEWSTITNADRVTSHDSEMTLHFLQFHDGSATCTKAGTQPYYQFDDTSVYSSMYDLDKQPIERPMTTPAWGHRVVMEHTVLTDPISVENTDTVPFQLIDGTWYSNNQTHSSSSQLTITALYACDLTLRYGVSSESNYDKLYILHNGTQKAMISGSVTNQAMTLDLAVGDLVTVRYTKDGSVSTGQDKGWVTLEYSEVQITEETDVPADTLEPDCTSAIVCDYCQTVIKDMTDHRYTAVVTPPTCTQEGFTTYTCTVCGDTVVTDVIYATGHAWTNGVCGNCDTVCQHDYVDGTCSVCGVQEEKAPEAPTIQFCYSQLQDSVRVQWTLVEGGDGYQLFRSTSPDGSTGWSCVKTVTDGSKNTYTNQGLTEGVTYYYKIRAYVESSKGRLYSDFSDVQFMPAAVVWNAPYSNSSFRIRLRWEQVGSAHGYQIWRKDENGEYRVVKTIGDRGNILTNDQGATTAYSNVDLTSGAKYTYKMRAFYITPDSGKVFGPFSDEVTVAVQPVAPLLNVTSPKAGRAQVIWEAANGADGYQVWMSEEADTGFAITKSITDGSITSYTKYDLESGKTYYFKIRAYVEVDGKKTFGAYTETIAITIL